MINMASCNTARPHWHWRIAIDDWPSVTETEHASQSQVDSDCDYLSMAGWECVMHILEQCVLDYYLTQRMFGLTTVSGIFEKIGMLHKTLVKLFSTWCYELQRRTAAFTRSGVSYLNARCRKIIPGPPRCGLACVLQLKTKLLSALVTIPWHFYAFASSRCCANLWVVLVPTETERIHICEWFRGVGWTAEDTHHTVSVTVSVNGRHSTGSDTVNMWQCRTHSPLNTSFCYDWYITHTRDSIINYRLSARGNSQSVCKSGKSYFRLTFFNIK